jgi:hypothetical protein
MGLEQLIVMEYENRKPMKRGKLRKNKMMTVGLQILCLQPNANDIKINISTLTVCVYFLLLGTIIHSSDCCFMTASK